MIDRLTTMFAIGAVVFLMWRAVQLFVFVVNGQPLGWRAALIGGSAIFATITTGGIIAFLVFVYRDVLQTERDHYGRVEALPALAVPAVTRIDGTTDEETDRITEGFDPSFAISELEELGYQRLGSYQVVGEKYQTSRAAFLAPDATSVVLITPAIAAALSFFGNRTLTTAAETALDYGFADIAIVSCLSTRPVPSAHAESLAVARLLGWEPDVLDRASALDRVCAHDRYESELVRQGELRRVFVRAVCRPRVNTADRLAKVLRRWGTPP